MFQENNDATITNFIALRAIFKYFECKNVDKRARKSFQERLYKWRKRRYLCMYMCKLKQNKMIMSFFVFIYLNNLHFKTKSIKYVRMNRLKKFIKVKYQSVGSFSSHILYIYIYTYIHRYTFQLCMYTRRFFDSYWKRIKFLKLPSWFRLCDTTIKNFHAD